MSILRDILQPVPQDPNHHPEGDVFKHSRMVRYSLPKSLEIFRETAAKPNSALSELGIEFSLDDIKLLKGGGWMHDIGKAGATTLNFHGTHYPYAKMWRYRAFGRIQAIAHERPQFFKPEMRRLRGTAYSRMWRSLPLNARVDLFFMIRYHMALGVHGHDRVGFGRRLSRVMVDEQGKYKNKRRIRLLLVLILMDRLGRSVPDPLADAWAAIEAFEEGALLAKRSINHPQSAPAPDDPEVFIKSLAAKPLQVLQMAFKGKFGRDMTEAEMKLKGE